MTLKKQDGVLISVIVPVYNVEQYVEECLESVLNQWNESMELIIIDDGSTDESGYLCQKEIEEHPNHLIRLITQSNQGLSAARNAALRLAEGKYVMFLDSDDMISDRCFEELNNSIKQYDDVDVFFFDAVTQDETRMEVNKMQYSRKNRVDNTVMTGQEYFCKYYLNPLIVSACMCLYRTDFIRQNDLEFTPGKLHEDIAFSFKIVLSAKKVIYIPEQLYIRRYRTNSITMQKVTIRHVQCQVDAYAECLQWITTLKCFDQDFTNALAEYFRIGLKYVFYTASQCAEGRNLVNILYKDVLEFLSMVKKENRGITYYKVLYEIYRFAVECPYMDEDMIVEVWGEITGTNSINNIEHVMTKRLEQFYHKLFERFPLDVPEKKIGIYGRGKHTRALLEKYQQLEGDIVADIIFIDSEEKSFASRYMNRDVINIKSVTSELDIIIISSFLYHNEMDKLCKAYANTIEIIDIYLQEKTPLF